ncbi:MAG: hypothetical protein JO013_11085 [Alphaproteobacteria bacterium]|nr:hypothetical protein [Alphaproteobacteria bacterium]
MDRSRARAGALIVVAAALAGATGAASLTPFPLREARWTAPAALPRSLSFAPPECLRRARSSGEARAVAIGRVAFRTPLLLGGQAARAGMSCATCHVNGRGNSAFLFPGLSGAPGTADVTASLMSSHRGDGVFNPKPIPDLAGPPDMRKISRTRPGALETFIHGLVSEEFDGPEPPPDVLAGLAAYVRALDPAACRGGAVRLRLRDRLAEVESAVALARTTGGETRRLLLAAARSTLGAVDERFAALPADRALLRAADADLAAIRADKAGFDRWDAAWPARKRRLLRDEGNSLYAAAKVAMLYSARGR